MTLKAMLYNVAVPLAIIYPRYATTRFDNFVSFLAWIKCRARQTL